MLIPDGYKKTPELVAAVRQVNSLHGILVQFGQTAFARAHARGDEYAKRLVERCWQALLRVELEKFRQRLSGESTNG